MKIFKLFRKSKVEECDDESLLDETKDACPVLYKERGYWACQKGWHEILAKLSYKIEELHERYYKRYKIRAEFVDIKEKWSSLRIEYNLIYDPSFVFTIISNFLEFILSRLEKIDFRMVTVEDCPGYILHEEKELTKVEYIKEKKYASNCSNVECYERDGKYYRVAEYDHYRLTHPEPSRFVILHKLMMWCNRLSKNIQHRDHKISKKRKMIYAYMHNTIDEYVKDAEELANNTCELCGLTIGEDWSPLCETVGWIRRLCQHCAESGDDDYYINGALMNKRNIIKTKEQIEAETCEKIKKNESIRKTEDAEYEKELAEAIEEENANKGNNI